jgi:nicotinamide-nucleotide amidase
MRLELITVGTELLLGHTIDTNGAELGLGLAQAGIRVTRRTTVADDAGAIREAVEGALDRARAALITGGLGPTADDVTKRVVADLFEMPLEFHPELWEGLLARFARFGRVPSERNRSQAEVPRGATVLPNRWGTAPGLWLENQRGLAILLPGVPAEMRKLLEHEVLPRLRDRGPGRVVRSRTLRTTGIAESALAERVGEVDAALAPLSLAYLPGLEGVDLRLTAWELEAADAMARLQAGLDLLRASAGEFAYGLDQEDLAALVLAEARQRGWRLVTAESCTGGGVGERITRIPGSSDVYLGGVIAYHNAVKVGELGVRPELIASEGAVSEPVVRAMAAGAIEGFGADVAVAVTGIAGPGGGTSDKPVGLVYLASLTRGATRVRRIILPGDRHEIRGRAAQAALFLLWQQLVEAPPATESLPI